MWQRRPVILVAAGAILVAGGAVAAVIASASSYSAPSLPKVAAEVAPKVTPSAPPSAAAYPRTVPVRVIIPAIGVNAAVEPVGLCPEAGMDCDGVPSGGLATPALNDGGITGWWSGGYAPGQNGPAVIVGHVDNPDPAVFWNLGKLVAGDKITVMPGNLTFTVTSVQQVSKDAFPTQEVYGATGQPDLRLITCGGTFDSATGHYESNVIVAAVLVASTG